MTRAVFFGTPELSVPFLEALSLDPDVETSLVVTQPDKPAGRKKNLVASPIKQKAEALEIECFQPSSLRSKKNIEKLRSVHADVFVVVAYGKIIPRSALELPPHGCVNVHPSLLPKYRGPSPLNAPIANGDRETGISIIVLDEGMDTGSMLGAKTIPLDPRETLETLTKKVMQTGPAFLLDTLKRYVAGKISPEPQNHVKATYTKLLTREDGHIDWHASVERIDRLIRAYEPWPGTWTLWNRSRKELRLKILSAHPSHERAASPAGVVAIKNDRILVACADESLEIDALQPESGQPMSAETFLRGYSDVKGAVLA